MMTLSCPHCAEPVHIAYCQSIPHMGVDGSEEQYYHPACALRLAIGGLNHLLHRCTCCGGSEPPDPPELSVRQAAHAAVVQWRSMQTYPRIYAIR